MDSELLTCIKNSLVSLNSERGGDRDFEKLCEEFIPRCIDSNFIPSSGSDSGGDGGIDGWSLFGNSGAIKYAFSIDSKTSRKIFSELDNCIYNRVRFFTNQIISQKLQEEIKKKYPNKDVSFFDRTAIAKFIEKNEDLGKYIGLKNKQHELDIAYIKNRRQFLLEDAKCSLPRIVSYTNNDGNLQTDSVEKFIESNPDFTILYAQAGYGKTECLKFIYNYVLDNRFEERLPPIFVSLSNYIGNNLLELINNAQVDSLIKDCLLLLDGFDEMKYSFRESFIKELKSFVLSNNSYERKVILTCRTSFYNKNDFIDFNPLEVELCPLSDDDIFKYVDLRIDHVEKQELLENKFFNSFKYNVFYLVKIVDYYVAQGNTVDNIPNLFRYICKNDIARLLHKNDIANIQTENYESLALYMIVNQKMRIDDNSILNEFGINNLTQILFSHKNIIEFLAAEKICRQNNFDEIKNILFSNGRVVPYLLNVFGFVLNILLNTQDRYGFFEKVLNYQLKTKNGLSLLKIESDKIDSEINYQIVKSILKNSYNMADYKDYVKDVSLFFINGSLYKNLNLLIFILENYENDKNQFALYLMLNLVLNYIDKIDYEFQERLYRLFKNVLQRNTDFSFIESLFFSVCRLPVCKKHVDDFEDNFEKLIRIVYDKKKFYDLVDCLANYVISCNICLKIEQYFNIYKLLIHILKTEESKGVENVPNQISKSDTTTYHHVIFFPAFRKLSADYFTLNPDLFWKVMSLISNEPTIVLDDNFELRDFFVMLSKNISGFLTKGKLSESQYNILLDILLKSPSAFDNHYLWNELNNSVLFSIGIKIVKDILIKTDANFMHYHFLINYCSLTIKTKDDFDLFYRTFNLFENQLLISFYNDYCFRINEKDSLYDYVYSKMTSKLKKEIKKCKNKLNKYNINFNERHIAKAKEDYHIVFDTKKLSSEVKKIFKDVGDNTVITKKEFLDYVADDYEHPDKPMINEFIAYWVKNIFRNYAKDEIDEDRIVTMIYSESWKYNYVIFLILFMNGHNIKFEDFTTDELSQIKKWAEFVLDNYPLKTVNSKLLQIHRFLSFILRQNTCLANDVAFCKKYAESLYGLIFSGFSSVVDGIWSCEYSYYSLEYLENYLSKKQIIKFITDNLNTVELASDKIIAVYGYLAENIGMLSALQKNLACKKITDYIHRRLTETGQVNFFEYAYDFGFKITMLPKNDLENAIILSDDGENLVPNYAYNIMFENKFLNKEEQQVIISIIRESFEAADNLKLKKILAEWEICINKSAGDIFVYYVDYLLNDSNKPEISSLFYHSVMCTEQLEHLPRIEQIFDYIKDKNVSYENQFYYYLNNVVMNSYRAIAKKVNSSDFKMLVKSIKRCEKEIPYYANLLDEVNNDFSKRNYVPITIDRIKKLR